MFVLDRTEQTGNKTLCFIFIYFLKICFDIFLPLHHNTIMFLGGETRRGYFPNAVCSLQVQRERVCV